MTIDEAIKQLFESNEFKEAAKTSAYLRTLLSRQNSNTLKMAAKIEVLLRFDYKIDAKRPRILKYKTNT